MGNDQCMALIPRRRPYIPRCRPKRECWWNLHLRKEKLKADLRKKKNSQLSDSRLRVEAKVCLLSSTRILHFPGRTIFAHFRPAILRHQKPGEYSYRFRIDLQPTLRSAGVQGTLSNLSHSEKERRRQRRKEKRALKAAKTLQRLAKLSQWTILARN